MIYYPPEMSILNSIKLLSDATRLRIVYLLEEESLTVAELQEILTMGQSRISTHLAAMKKEGLVKDERSGKNITYSLTLSPSLLSVAHQAKVEIPEIDHDKLALELALQKREDETKAYFDAIAGKFGRNYVPGRSWKGLAEAFLRMASFDIVADLGAGEALVSRMLAQRAKKVIAIDNSPQMVAFGTKMAQKEKLTNLEYRLGDIETPPLEPESIHLALFSQSLHHAHSPQKAIESAYTALTPGACLIILDLVKHTFEKARELYADRWLGFTKSEMVTMLQSTGFTDIYIDNVDREPKAPHFETLLAVAWKK